MLWNKLIAGMLTPDAGRVKNCLERLLHGSCCFNSFLSGYRRLCIDSPTWLNSRYKPVSPSRNP